MPINLINILSSISIVLHNSIPSSPELISTTSSLGYVIIRVSTPYPGDNITFQFNVTIIDITDNSTVRTENFPFLNYISNTTVSLTIELPNGGLFSFIIITTNQYGISEVTMTTRTITVPPSKYILHVLYELMSC